MGFHPILKEKILSVDNLATIKVLLSEIYNIQNIIDGLLNINIEKENPIEDENDYDFIQFKNSSYFDYNKGNGYYDYNKLQNELEISDNIGKYENLLTRLISNIDASLVILSKKTTEEYRLFYKLKEIDILKSIDKNDFELQAEKMEGISNPYKKLYNDYMYYYSIISILNDNILFESGNIYEQARLITVGLSEGMTGNFDNLKKWEDNIIISAVSMEGLTGELEEKINSDTIELEKTIKLDVNEVENILSGLGVRKI